MTGKPARKHHTVPNFYLKYFASEKEEITTIDKITKKSFTKSTSSTSFIKKFYSINTIDPEIREDEFEIWLSNEFEGPASIVFEKILNKNIWPLCFSDRVTLAKFITLQVLRSPDMRRQLHNDLIGFAYQILKFNPTHPDAEEVRKFFSTHYPNDTIPEILYKIENETFLRKKLKLLI